MNGGRMRQQMQLLTTLAAVLALNFVLVGCTSKREPGIKDGQLRNEIFEIAELQNQSFSISTEAEALKPASAQANVLAKSEKPAAKIAATTAPTKLQALLMRQTVSAAASSDYQIVTRVNRSFVTVLKLVKDASELSALDRQLAQKVKGGSLVPILKFRVTRVGILERAKNDDGDRTSTLVLTETPFASATHIQLSLNPEDTPSIVESSANKKTLEEIFSAEALNRKVTTLSELQKSLNFSLQGFQDGKVYTTLNRENGHQAALNIYRIKKESDYTDPRILAKLRGSIDTGNIAYCPEALRTSLGLVKKSECVIELAYQLEGEFVTARFEVNPDPFSDQKIETATVNIAAAGSTQKTGIVKFAKAMAPTAVGTEWSVVLSPFDTLRKADILGKEFFLRRTFEDGASTIMAFGPGGSGDMDLVKFELKDGDMAGRGTLTVRKILSVNGDKNTTEFDKEPLMQFPVVLRKRDPARGSAGMNIYDRAFAADAEYITLDWSQNKVDSINSPFSSTYGVGGCFSSEVDNRITDVDNRMSSDGVLNFSLRGTYSFRPDCISYHGTSDYWLTSKLQTTFEMKERVSFMWNKGTLDNKFSYELPYMAQRLMGFGVWTDNELVPNAAGSLNSMSNQKARMVIHDFSGGKQLVYVLGGLPESGWVREALIDGTKEVVDQWNKTLAYAFRNTALARDFRVDQPYIVLKIDGVDVPSGRLGDLDRNYIWNFTKNLDSGLLGMSQPSSNPRSGRIEQNNVLMYSGNVLGMIDGMQRSARLLEAYENLKRQAIAEANERQKQAQSSQGGQAAQGGAQAQQGNDAQRLAKLLSISNVDSVKNNLMQILKVNSLKQRDTKIPAASLDKFQKDFATQIAAVRSGTRVSSGAGTPASGSLANSRAQQFLYGANADLEKTFIARVLKRIMAEKAAQDHVAVDAIVDNEILKSFGDQMTPNARAAMAAKSRRSALLAQFNKTFNSGARCAQIVRDSSGAVDVLKTPTEELFRQFYKSTLSHEIGHSLGLTHNFEGSRDLANFRFNESEKSHKEGGRNYSSIMDYIEDRKQNFQGPGPYDARALRVAYTNLVELHPEALNKLKKNADGTSDMKNVSGQLVKVKVLNDRELHLSDVKKLTVGENGNWFNLNSYMLQNRNFAIHPYRYCNDRDAGYYVSCKRWDVGEDDLFVALDQIESYRNIYPVSGYRADRVEFGYEQFGRYISRVSQSLIDLRLFLDESFLQAVTSGQPENPTFLAAYVAKALMIENIGRPTSPLPFMHTARFTLLPYKDCAEDEKGNPKLDENKACLEEVEKQTLVEARSLENFIQNDNIDTIGFQYDKVIAMQLLTMQGVGHPRYESLGLRFNAVDFDQYFSDEYKGPLSSPIVSVLYGNMIDNPIPFAQPELGMRLALNPLQFRIENNELIRFYTAVASNMLLRSETLEAKYNRAAWFGVGSTLNGAVPSTFYVTKLDEDPGMNGVTKLWAFPNAQLSKMAVRRAMQQRTLLNAPAELGENFAKLAIAASAAKQAEMQVAFNGIMKGLADLNQNELLETAAEAAAPAASLAGRVKRTIPVLAEVNSYIQMIVENKISDEDTVLLPELQGLFSAIGKLQQTEPIIGFALDSLMKHYPKDGGDEKHNSSAIARAFKSGVGQNIEFNYGMTVSNLDFGNQIGVMLDPRLNR